MRRRLTMFATVLAGAALTAGPFAVAQTSSPEAPKPPQAREVPIPPGAGTPHNGAEKDRPANTTPPSATTREPPKPAGR